MINNDPLVIGIDMEEVFGIDSITRDYYFRSALDRGVSLEEAMQIFYHDKKNKKKERNKCPLNYVRNVQAKGLLANRQVYLLI